MLADHVAAALPELRAQAESRMTSTVTIRRRGAETAQDETTGLEGPAWSVVASAVPFRLKGGRSRTVSIGGVEFEEATAEGHLPADVVDLADNDLLEVTAGEWPGTVWRVVEAVKGDQRTARRVPVVEVARPGEWA